MFTVTEMNTRTGSLREGDMGPCADTSKKRKVYVSYIERNKEGVYYWTKRFTQNPIYLFLQNFSNSIFTFKIDDVVYERASPI